MSTATNAPPHTFRDATAADLPRLCELFERFRAESHYAKYGPAHPEVSTPFIESLLTADDRVVLVVEAEAQIVGMIGVVVTQHPMSGERCATEMFWYLEPEFRGSGVWLLRRAERWALDRGAKFILMVSPQSHAVDRIYEALGYEAGETSWYKSLDWFARHTPPRATRIPHGIRVHDDVLPDPMAYRAMALQQRFQAVQDGAVVFQGIAPCADPSLPIWIKEQYPRLRPTLSFFRHSPRGQVEPHTVHDDRSMGDVTCIFYLNPGPPEHDGTSFFKHALTRAVASTSTDPDEHLREAMAWHDPGQWEEWYRVSARFNRLMLFPAKLFHSRAIEENYGSDERARLIQVVFCAGVLS